MTASCHRDLTPLEFLLKDVTTSQQHHELGSELLTHGTSKSSYPKHSATCQERLQRFFYIQPLWPHGNSEGGVSLLSPLSRGEHLGINLQMAVSRFRNSFPAMPEPRPASLTPPVAPGMLTYIGQTAFPDLQCRWDCVECEAWNTAARSQLSAR